MKCRIMGNGTMEVLPDCTAGRLRGLFNVKQAEAAPLILPHEGVGFQGLKRYKKGVRIDE